MCGSCRVTSMVFHDSATEIDLTNVTWTNLCNFQQTMRVRGMQ